MIELIDSHCHLNMLDLTAFDDGLPEVMIQARQHDVVKMLSVCVSLTDLPALHAIADRYSHVYTSVGIHPNDSTSTLIDANQLAKLARHPSCIAMGETGLDYYREDDLANRTIQRQQFREHIQAACLLKKPLIIHTREASEDTLQVMREEDARDIGGVMHCFSEDWEVARQALDMNFYISFSGIVTFKNAHLIQEVARKVPMDRILIETDAPYLAPIPFRGKQNQPAYVQYVARHLAVLRNMEYEAVAFSTTKNFYDCFRLQVWEKTHANLS